MTTLRLRTGSWYGDVVREFPLPEDWVATVFPQQDAPALSPEAVESAFRKPIGSAPLSVLAKGKMSAVLVVDDLSRPTPVEMVCLRAMDELNLAGIPDKQIVIVIGGGAHRPLTQREMGLKLGQAMKRAGSVSAHDAYESEVDYFGTSSRGTPVLINRLVARAEFSIAISGIYPLEVAGFGGGAKMIMPGVSHVSSIHWNHSRLSIGTRAGNLMESEQRRDMEEVAGIFALDAIASVIINSRREVCGVFVGDPTEAHRQGVAFARKVYYTDFDQDGKYDLTIANAYPLDADPQQLCKSTWVLDRFGVPAVIISEFQDPVWYHGLGNGPYREFKKHLPQMVLSQTEEDLMTASRFLFNREYGKTFFPQAKGWYYENDWNHLIECLAKRFPRARVRVLPTASIQY